MKCLNRNKKRCWYALFDGKEPVTDEWGNETGEYIPVRSDPVEMQANVSSASGESEYSVFGSSLQYDKVLVLSDSECPITENSVVWIDNDPKNQEPDYYVRRVSRSLNSIAIALTRVEINGN